MKSQVYKYYVTLYSLLYRVLIKLLPINKSVILFESTVGRSYSGNPKYIYEELVRQGLDIRFNCIWILEDTRTAIPGKCIKLKKMRGKHLLFASIARLWIVDSRISRFFFKRKGCRWIQTWHGTPLKRLALDMQIMNIAGDTNLNQYQSQFVDDAQQWDFLVSQNLYSTDRFKSAFGYCGTVWELGYPRNDILFSCNNKSSINIIKTNLGLPLNKKVILYAPTWRDDEYIAPGKWKLNLHFNLDRMVDQFGNEFIMVIKQHYFQQDDIQLTTSQKNFVYTFDSSQDIQLLYLVSDLMITDYSSVMFDYSILKRPMIFYLYDFEKYKNELRGFYFDISKEGPGPIVTDEEQLILAISSWETIFDDYFEKYSCFVEKFNDLDDGKAAVRVVDKIKQLLIGQ